MRRRPRAVALVGALVGTLGLLLTGCTATAPAPSAPSGSPVASVSVDADIVYRTVDGQPLALEACIPKPARQAPALILLHAGGFSNGTRTDLGDLCRTAARAGMATFSVDYRLLPAHDPDQVKDVAAAIDWLAEPAQRTRFSLQQDRVALLGASAGAVIGAQLATRTPGSPLDPKRLRAVALLSGLYDANGDLGQLQPVAAAYLGCSDASASCTSTLRSASAATAATKGDPPMLLVNSTKELVPLSQLTTFAATLQAKGIPHRTVVVPGDAHAEAVFVTHPEIESRVLRFLQQALFAR